MEELSNDPEEYIIDTVLSILQNITVPDPSPASVYDIPVDRQARIEFQPFYYERLIKYLIQKHSQRPHFTLPLALALVIRITSEPNLTLSETNIYRLFSVALVIAQKFLLDGTYNNQYCAKVIGISTKSLNIMEKDFLERLNYRIQTECTLEVINRFFPPESLPTVYDMTPPKIAQFVDALHTCRLQQLRQNQEQ